MTQYKKFLLPAVLLSLLIVSSCHKDLGNYAYHDINEIKIETKDSVLSILYADTLRVNPVLTFSQDPVGVDSAYTYEWVATRVGGTPADPNIVLSTARNLKVSVVLPAASYNLYYRVKDKKTGIVWTKAFFLDVKTTISEGYLILNDVNGMSRLDMLSYRKNPALKDTFYQITDVLTTVGSTLPPQGKPYQVFTYRFGSTGFAGSGNHRIYLLTESGTNQINAETFQYDIKYNIKYDFAAKVPDGFKGDYMDANPSCIWLVSGGNLYSESSTNSLKMNQPVNTIPGENSFFNVSTAFATSGTEGMFFDTDHKRFVKKNTASVNMVTMPVSDSFKFPYNVGMTLVHMEYNTGRGSVFAVLKDAAKNKYYLAGFKMTGAQDYFADITGATDIDKAEKFATNLTGTNYLFYSVGGKVYECEYTAKSSNPSKLMIDKGPTAKISVLKFQQFLYGAIPARAYYKEWGSKLMVCSYDQAGTAGSNGKMELYTIPAILGANFTLYQSYSGFGKIVSVAYRERQ